MSVKKGPNALQLLSEWVVRNEIVRNLNYAYSSFLIILIIIAAAAPLYMSAYWERVFTFIFISIALAQTWNIIGGYAGYFSFGHGVFFGIGAFTAAQLIMRYGVNFWVSLPVCGLTSAALSIMFFPIMRIKGFYFAMATLGTLLSVQVVFKMVPFIRGLKGGDDGWLFPDLGGLHFFYLIMLSLVVIISGFVHIMVKSKFGYGLRALLHNEVTASCMGIPTTLHKCMALMAAAFWAGVIGGVYGPFITYISTESVFALSWTLDMIVMTLVGGIGTVMGPIVGGFVLAIINQLVWSQFPYFHIFIYGILIIVIILFLPSGIIASIRSELLLGRYRKIRLGASRSVK